MAADYFTQLMHSVLGSDRPIVRLRLGRDVWNYLLEMDKDKSDFGVSSFNFNGVPAVLDVNIPPDSFIKEYGR